jgi:Ca2+/Na+ antiporter
MDTTLEVLLLLLLLLLMVLFMVDDDDDDDDDEEEEEDEEEEPFDASGSVLLMEVMVSMILTTGANSWKPMA